MWHCLCMYMPACICVFCMEYMPPFYRRNLLDVRASIFPCGSHKVPNMLHDLALVTYWHFYSHDCGNLSQEILLMNISISHFSNYCFFFNLSQGVAFGIVLSSFFYCSPFTAAVFSWNWLLWIKTASYIFFLNTELLN